MAGGVGQDRAEQGGVEHQHGAGDARHAAGHDDEQFAARQRREVGPDEQRRLDHAEKDVGCGRQADRAADAERPFEQPGEAAHDRRQDAPVEQQRGEHAHHQHHRQGLQREDEIGARRLEVVGQGAAAEIAEDERRAGPRRGPIAPTASLMAAKAVFTPGTLSSSAAVAKVTARPMAACFHDTARRFSLIAQAKPRNANTPSADCRCCIKEPVAGLTAHASDF